MSQHSVTNPTGTMSAYVVLVAASAALAGLIFGYDMAVINSALVFLSAHFHMSSVQTELFASVLLWGCAVGAASAGVLSDRFGRRIVLFVAGLLFFVSAISVASADVLWQLFAARIVGGLGVGLALVVAPLYIAEISPPAVRGRLVTFNQLALVSGVLVSFMCNYQLAQSLHGNWRWMFALEAIPAALLCLSLLWIPESPRWLVQNSRRDAARAVLLRISPGADVKPALDEIFASISAETGSFRDLLSRKLRKPMILVVMLAIIQQVTGVNTVLYYGAIIFAEHAGASAGQAIGMNILVGASNLIFTIVAFFAIDRFGRRPLLLTATGGMAVCLAAFAAMLVWMPGQSLLLLLPVLGYVAFFAFGLGAGVWVCLSELLPSQVRGKAMSVATMVLWIAVSVVTATFLSLIKAFSAPAVFLGYAVVCAASFLYISLSLPETKNRTLEEIGASWTRK